MSLAICHIKTNPAGLVYWTHINRCPSKIKLSGSKRSDELTVLCSQFTKTIHTLGCAYISVRKGYIYLLFIQIISPILIG